MEDLKRNKSVAIKTIYLGFPWVASCVCRSLEITRQREDRGPDVRFTDQGNASPGWGWLVPGLRTFRAGLQQGLPRAAHQGPGRATTLRPGSVRPQGSRGPRRPEGAEAEPPPPAHLSPTSRRRPHPRLRAPQRWDAAGTAGARGVGPGAGRCAGSAGTITSDGRCARGRVAGAAGNERETQTLQGRSSSPSGLFTRRGWRTRRPVT